MEPTPFIREFFQAPPPNTRSALELTESNALYDLHLRNAEAEVDFEDSRSAQRYEVWNDGVLVALGPASLLVRNRGLEAGKFLSLCL